MEYDRLIQILKRFSFEEKMRIAQLYSKQTINVTGLVEIDKLRSQPLPWELETFVLFAIKSMEWKSDDFRGKNESTFIKIINCIKNYTHPVLEQHLNPLSFLDHFMLAMSAVQFDIQEFYPYKLYRYNYYFSFVNEKINMPELFSAKFGCEYKEFLVFSQFLWLVFADKAHTLPQEAFEYLISKFSAVISQLTISRQRYIEKLDNITKDPSDYLYCLRPSYTYPFISENQIIYLPLPHLLMRAITSSLLFRLTDGNDNLIRLIGKEVLEPYLYKIILESNLFDEVVPEQNYYVRKKEQRTLDVMARKGDYYLFFDSKSYTPKRDLRIFSETIFEIEVERLAKACKQVYLHIHNRFPDLYNFFTKSEPVASDKIFGLVVVREDPHITAEHIYTKAAEMLNIEINSSDYKWFCKHVGLVSISEIERYCFTQSDIVGAVRINSETGRINDHWLCGQLNHSIITNKSVLEFKQELSDSVLKVAKDLHDSGVLPN